MLAVPMWHHESCLFAVDCPESSETVKVLGQAVSKPNKGHVGLLNRLGPILGGTKPNGHRLRKAERTRRTGLRLGWNRAEQTSDNRDVHHERDHTSESSRQRFRAALATVRRRPGCCALVRGACLGLGDRSCPLDGNDYGRNFVN